MAKKKRFNGWILVLLCLALLFTAVIGSGFSLNFSTLLEKIKGEASEDEADEVLFASLGDSLISSGFYEWSYSGKDSDYMPYLLITGLTPGKQYRIDLSYFAEESDYCNCDKGCHFNSMYISYPAPIGFLCLPDLNDLSDITYDYQKATISELEWDTVDYCLRTNGESFVIIPEGDSLLIILGHSYMGFDILSHIYYCNVYEVKG